MSEVLITKGEVEEGSNPTLRRILVDNRGVALLPSDVIANGITLNVFDLASDNPDEPFTIVPSLDPNVLMFGALQTDGWDQSSDGYNMMYTPDLTALGTVGGRTYAFEFKFDLIPSNPTKVAWALFEVAVRAVRSS